MKERTRNEKGKKDRGQRTDGKIQREKGQLGRPKGQIVSLVVPLTSDV
jgi:hypothetical protein